MTLIQVTTVIFIVLSIKRHPASADDPCTARTTAIRYTQFVRKHVLISEFDRNSLEQWERYLKDMNLWCIKGRPVQSFLERSQNVEDICTSGRRVQNGGNLCISTSEMEVYDIITTFGNNGCRIDENKKNPRKTFVVVACDKVDNRCLPVHFEEFKGQQPSNVPCQPGA